MLDDFARPGVSTNLEPVFGGRLLRLLKHFGGRVVIDSGFRTRAQQQKLYDDWVDSGKRVPSIVAVPGTSKHELDPAEAADLHRLDSLLTWGEVHYTADAFGLCFPIPREDWHCEAVPDWTDPEPPEDDDMGKVEWRILAPAGSAAKFIAPMAPLPDGTLAALYATWLPSGPHVDEWSSRGVVELPCGVEDLRNVTLLGPLPTGDAREWTAADWLAVA